MNSSASDNTDNGIFIIEDKVVPGAIHIQSSNKLRVSLEFIEESPFKTTNVAMGSGFAVSMCNLGNRGGA